MTYSAKQIIGYQSQLKGAVYADRTGAEVTIDLKTAQALIEICQQAADKPSATFYDICNHD